MTNPFDSQPDFGSYVNLRTRMLQKMRDAHVHDRIIELASRAMDEALESERVVLSQPEKKRLLSQTLRSILDEDLPGTSK